LTRTPGNLLPQCGIVGHVNVFERNAFFGQQSLCCGAKASIIC
jgi:hypothetical protein